MPFFRRVECSRADAHSERLAQLDSVTVAAFDYPAQNIHVSYWCTPMLQKPAMPRSNLDNSSPMIAALFSKMSSGAVGRQNLPARFLRGCLHGGMRRNNPRNSNYGPTLLDLGCLPWSHLRFAKPWLSAVAWPTRSAPTQHPPLAGWVFVDEVGGT